MALCHVLWWVLSDEQAHSSDLEYGSINIILCTLNTLNTNVYCKIPRAKV